MGKAAAAVKKSDVNFASTEKRKVSSTMDVVELSPRLMPDKTGERCAV